MNFKFVKTLHSSENLENENYNAMSGKLVRKISSPKIKEKFTYWHLKVLRWSNFVTYVIQCQFFLNFGNRNDYYEHFCLVTLTEKPVFVLFYNFKSTVRNLSSSMFEKPAHLHTIT